MQKDQHYLPFPRRHLPRAILRLLGRILLPIFFKIEIQGRRNFPKKGPLLVVGNHTAAMEAVLLTVYSPWQIEMLSAADIPAEKITEWVSGIYGVIPLYRGAYDRTALSQALSVLDQQGILGLFPEGGIWEAGKKQAHAGISWLSYRSGAPVLPIGFNDTTGALNAALSFKRPRLWMRVGDLIPAAALPANTPRKIFFQAYADKVMAAVHFLLPAEGERALPEMEEETFDLEVTLRNTEGQFLPFPGDLAIAAPAETAKFFHRPAILKIFQVNLDLPIQPLTQLADQPRPEEIARALNQILTYLEDKNPHLLTYRFGIREGLAMQEGLASLARLAAWAGRQNIKIVLKPIRRYYSPSKKKYLTQITQESFKSWM